MRIPGAPSPRADLAELVTLARRALDHAMSPTRQTTPAALAEAWSAYALACAAAGVLPPPPLADWPASGPARKDAHA